MPRLLLTGGEARNIIEKMAQPVVALMTDFGEDDYFVASLKAVILSINSRVQIVDITHSIKSYDIRSAAFILYSCFRFFPRGTIFLAVVDPGVGSKRKILLARTQKGYFFIAPDNGLLSMALMGKRSLKIWEVTNERYFLPDSSSTFEARDKMAPVVAWLSKGVPPDEFGKRVYSFKKFEVKRAHFSRSGISARILYEDKFGNLITNILADRVKARMAGKMPEEAVMVTGTDRLKLPFRKSYSFGKKGELFYLVGSLGLLEIAARESSASQKLGLKAGDDIKLLFTKASHPVRGKR